MDRLLALSQNPPLLSGLGTGNMDTELLNSPSDHAGRVGLNRFIFSEYTTVCRRPSAPDEDTLQSQVHLLDKIITKYDEKISTEKTKVIAHWGKDVLKIPHQNSFKK